MNFLINRTSIKWKILFSITVFTAGILILLWLFQIVFLDGFYRKVKENSINNVAESITSSIDTDSLVSSVRDASVNNDMCIRVIGENGTDILSYEHIVGCVIHRMTPSEIQVCYEKALDNGGSYLEKMSINDFLSSRGSAEEQNRFPENYRTHDIQTNDNLVYVEVVHKNKKVYMIMIGTSLAPLAATTETLKFIFIFLVISFLIMATLFTLMISKYITRPISQISETAKELASGNCDVVFQGSGYDEIEKLRDTLNYAAKELNKLEKLRNELIANISHDLRTPLTLITGYSEVMRDIPGENTPENVQVIIDEAQHLSEIVNETLDLSKFQAGEQKLNLELLNLDAFLKLIVSRYDKLNSQYNIEYRNELPNTSNKTYIKADTTQLERVMANLMNNAINYTGADKRVVVRASEFIRDDGRSFARVEVIDTGKGISQEEIEHIWDRYYRTNDKHKRAKIGSGLGLAIVKVLLDMHNAYYGVVSGKDGSTFWFEIETEQKNNEEMEVETEKQSQKHVGEE